MVGARHRLTDISQEDYDMYNDKAILLRWITLVIGCILVGSSGVCITLYYSFKKKEQTFANKQIIYNRVEEDEE